MVVLLLVKDMSELVDDLSRGHTGHPIGLFCRFRFRLPSRLFGASRSAARQVPEGCSLRLDLHLLKSRVVIEHAVERFLVDPNESSQLGRRLTAISSQDAENSRGGLGRFIGCE
ncbi:unannotated protein [freshwater metagenome]|uniref:Unannotated protein n=1 Tax=freshwater metagenome TaxID=449393 RepID=A0A6J6X8F3_9ZZZZ